MHDVVTRRSGGSTTGEPPGVAATRGHPILDLQRMAGNAAVAGLLGRPTVQRFWPFDDDEEAAPEAEPGQEAPSEVPAPEPGDEPEDEFTPAPEEPEPRPVAWPEDAEAERNEPCFDPDAQGGISLGTAWADAAAIHLSRMPPDLPAAVAEMTGAIETWEGVFGSDPGQAALNEATGLARRAAARVAARVEPVDAMLNQLLTAALAASGDASEAAGSMTAPTGEDEEPWPCFDQGQQAVIAEAVALADSAATELGKRPPNYPKALATLRNAAGKLGALGGEAPGQAKLSAAVATLDQVINAVAAYLDPVATVVAEAAADMRAAGAGARSAAVTFVPAPYAAGGDAEPPA